MSKKLKLLFIALMLPVLPLDSVRVEEEVEQNDAMPINPEESERAGECSAVCGDGVSVTCEGSSCQAEDGVGCSAIVNGQVVAAQCVKEEAPFSWPG